MPHHLIPEHDYTKIFSTMPIPCVDLVIEHAGKVLLVKRKHRPAQGVWWFPGGRVFKGERLTEAAVRKAHEEVGLNVQVIRRIGAYETMFEDAFSHDVAGGTHTINVCCLVEPIGANVEVKLDDTSADFRWLTNLEATLPPYVQQVLRDAGVFSPLPRKKKLSRLQRTGG